MTKQINLPQDRRPGTAPDPMKDSGILVTAAQIILGALLFAILAGGLSYVAVSIWQAVLSKM